MPLTGRRGVAGRRPGPAQERSVRGVPWVRLGAVAGLVVLGAAAYWLSSAGTFAVDADAVPVTGTRFTDAAQIRTAMGLPPGSHPNVFGLASTDMARQAEALPAVQSARVTIRLPDQVSVAVIERTPMLVWRHGETAWLVDVEGVAFAPASALDPAALGDGSTGSALPEVDDQRPPPTPLPAPSPAPLGSPRLAASAAPDHSPLPSSTLPPTDSPSRLGDRLDATDLAAVRLLAALTPELIGSTADHLSLSVDEASGYVLTGGRWRAVFGPYTPDALSPSRIPAQVQCLRSLLGSREKQLAEVTLAVGSSATEACGTFRQATPAPNHPARTPKP